MTFGPYAIFASGGGTNAMALSRRGGECGCPPEFIFVNSVVNNVNKQESPLEAFARENKIPYFYQKGKVKGIDRDLERAIEVLLKEHNIQWIFLAGYLKILSPEFLKSFPSRDGVAQVINIHPSLLPLYPGLGGYKKAFDNGDDFFGHTIHFVTEELDRGPIISQKKLPRLEGESFEDMVERAKREENENYANILETLIKKGALEGYRL